jgi:hypothetical protein
MNLTYNVDFKEIEKALQKVGGALNDNGRKTLLKRLGVQVINETTRRIVKSEDIDGNKKEFKDTTTKYIYKTNRVKPKGSFRWNKRASGKNYSSQSQYWNDTGKLRNSIDFLLESNRKVIIGIKGFAERYGYYQNSLGPFLGVNNKTIQNFKVVTQQFINEIIQRSGLDAN